MEFKHNNQVVSKNAKEAYTMALNGVLENTTSIGVTQPIPGREAEMRPNRGGGYGFTVDWKTHLTRILILGSDNGYYSSRDFNTAEAINSIRHYHDQGHGVEMVELVRDVYLSGRASKQDPTFTIMAFLCRSPELQVRKQAFELVIQLRTFSQLCTFLKYYQVAGQSKGWGRLPKESIKNWITKQDARSLSYQVFKYLSREGWTFRDLLRCIHIDPKGVDPSTQTVLRLLAKYGSKNMTNDEAFAGALDYGQEIGASPNEIEYLTGIRFLKTCSENDEGAINKIVELIGKHNYTREFLPTWALKEPTVWRALLFGGQKITMPFTALIRNLGNLTTRSLFDDEQLVTLVAEHIQNEEVVRKSKIHPATIAIAWKQYMVGHGDKGSSNWIPVRQIVDALEKAIHLAFANVQPTGKKILHAFDGSGSMTCPMNGVLPCMTSAEAVGLLGLVCSNTEDPNTQQYVVFSSQRGVFSQQIGSHCGLRPVPFTPGMNLNNASRITQITDWGSTDCSLPIEKAIIDFKTKYDTLAPITKQEFQQALSNENKQTCETILRSLGVFLPEVFIIYTDNDVNSGKRQPSLALKEYRQLTGIPAKMAVVATQSSRVSIADPKDAHMLDFTGFDSALPSLLHDFIADEI